MINKKTYKIVSILIVTLVAGYGNLAFAGDVSVRDNLNNNEALALMVEEDRTIPVYLRIKEAFKPEDKKVVTKNFYRPCAKASVRNSMTADKRLALAKEEDRSLREFEFKDIPHYDDDNAHSNSLVPCSIRANLDAFDKKALKKEEDKSLREFEL
ncbi:hypothetical protein KAH27_07445 [bacterium]|nr:hypothetical protein [bacterium]